MTRVWARLRQVLYYLFARSTADDLRRAALELSPGLFELYRSMGPQDQAHGARVANRLRSQGAPSHVVAAAYLHDAGKPLGYGLLWRCVGVLTPGRPPGRPPGQSPTEPARSCGPLAWARLIYHRHDSLAAEAIARQGGGDDLQALVTGTPGTPWLAEFERADDAG